MFSVGLICEGPSDYQILLGVLDSILNSDYQPTRIQPPFSAMGGDSGNFGGGWKGVRLWCQQIGRTSLDTILENHDLLILHLDADVVLEADYGCSRSCPPAEGICECSRLLPLAWLSRELPSQAVLCVPSMATETWALASLFPESAIVGDDPLECRQDIKALLRDLGKNFKPKLVVMQEGHLKNQANGYRAQQENIGRGWQRCCERCSQAKRFNDDVRKVFLQSA